MSKFSSNLPLWQPVQIFEQFIDDRDCQSYRFAKIGTQTWMVENLAFEITPGSKIYRDDPANLTKYGRLYDFETAKKACPRGWHLPCKEEWEKLINFSRSPDSNDFKVPEAWKENRKGDTLGFAALPGGYCDSDGFHDVGKVGYWWVAPDNSGNAYRLRISYNYDDILYNEFDKNSLLSVRCVKDC
ncbi:MAG: hypothetical protein LBC75_03745 [Fibromonadaceae bacterium]|nr:hypothetical protein [Fibromonadaceae bacterium]